MRTGSKISQYLLIAFFCALLSGSWMWGCRQNDPSDSGTVQLTFRHQVGSAPLNLNADVYANASGESFTVSLLQYFVSNIRLRRADGSEYIVPPDDSYFLVKADDPASQTLTLPNVPAGTYTGLSFLLGVDSLRNTMDISRRKGVLEPAGAANAGMYWDWNSGYIFFKMEGTSPQAPANATGAQQYQYHIGLFGGYTAKTLNNLRTVTLPMGSASLTVSQGRIASGHITADVGKVFDGVTPIRIAQTPLVMVSPVSAAVANNYAAMFRYESSN